MDRMFWSQLRESGLNLPHSISPSWFGSYNRTWNLVKPGTHLRIQRLVFWHVRSPNLSRYRISSNQQTCGSTGDKILLCINKPAVQENWILFPGRALVPMYSCASSYDDVQSKTREALSTNKILTWCIATLSWWISVSYQCVDWQSVVAEKANQLENIQLPLNPIITTREHQKFRILLEMWCLQSTRNCQEPKHQVWQIFFVYLCPTLPVDRQCEFNGPWTLKMNRTMYCLYLYICVCESVYTIYMYTYICINKNSGCICMCLWGKNTPRHM